MGLPECFTLVFGCNYDKAGTIGAAAKGNVTYLLWKHCWKRRVLSEEGDIQGITKKSIPLQWAKQSTQKICRGGGS